MGSPKRGKRSEARAVVWSAWTIGYGTEYTQHLLKDRLFGLFERYIGAFKEQRDALRRLLLAARRSSFSLGYTLLHRPLRRANRIAWIGSIVNVYTPNLFALA